MRILVDSLKVMGIFIDRFFNIVFFEGWHGNVERRNRGVTMASTAPVVEGGMTR